MKNITHRESLKGFSLLLLSAFLYSIMPVMIRILGRGGIPVVSQVFLRYIFAFLASAFYFFLISKSRIKFEKKDIFFVALAAVFGYALTNLFFTYGILFTQVSNALFLFYTYAIIAPVLGFLFLRERINPVNVISLILSLIALTLVFRPNSLKTWQIGGIFAILSALGQSSYLILRKKLHKYPADLMMLISTFLGVITLGILSLILESGFYFQGQITSINSNVWLTTVLFGIDNFFAWFTLTKGFEYFKATSGSLILLSELVFGIILAFLFFREIPSITTVIGGVLIIFSSTFVIFWGAK